MLASACLAVCSATSWAWQLVNAGLLLRLQHVSTVLRCVLGQNEAADVAFAGLEDDESPSFNLIT